MKRSAALLLLLALAACDSAEPDPVLSGTYVGAFEHEGSSGTHAIDVTLSVTEGADGALTGTVIMDVAGLPFGLTVSGTHTYPDFTMRFESSSFDDIVYSGTTSATGARLDGEMNGSGYADVDLTLAR